MSHTITCAICGKQEERSGRGGIQYCLACGRIRARSMPRAKSKNGQLQARIEELEDEVADLKDRQEGVLEERSESSPCNECFSGKMADTEATKRVKVLEEKLHSLEDVHSRLGVAQAISERQRDALEAVLKDTSEGWHISPATMQLIALALGK